MPVALHSPCAVPILEWTHLVAGIALDRDRVLRLAFSDTQQKPPTASRSWPPRDRLRTSRVSVRGCSLSLARGLTTLQHVG